MARRTRPTRLNLSKQHYHSSLVIAEYRDMKKLRRLGRAGAALYFHGSVVVSSLLFRGDLGGGMPDTRVRTGARNQGHGVRAFQS